MKKAILLTICLLSALAVPSFGQPAVPSSPRSREVVARIRPKLLGDFSDAGLVLGAPIFMRIFKQEKALEVWVKTPMGFKLFRSYKICTYGPGYLGPKTRQGDGMAPEGFYFVTPGRINPASNFHLSFNLGYPNRYDRWHQRTGSALMVHGSCVSIGCYAMTDQRIEEIFTIADAALRNGQDFFRVHIFPFKMTATNMKKHQGARWYGFWENLKQGYDLFEQDHQRPPNVEVSGGKYIFE